ncbi:MAG TPA: hypothetical protein VMS63_07365 [Gaiellaceae bacterium]|nr:hypothetical protein [Gaiellaceae bacterium]
MALTLAIAGFVVALAALLLTFALEWLKRPRLTVDASLFRPGGPTQWTFATVEVRNDPSMPWPFRMFLSRQSADACEVALEFRRSGEPALALPPIQGRWSSQPEPIRREPIVLPQDLRERGSPDSPQGPLIQLIPAFDPAMAQASRRMDVAAADRGEQVAIAVLRHDGTAFAWGAESYAFPGWQNPDWQLDRGTYDVTVRVRGSGVEVAKAFELPFLSGNFAAFVMRPRGPG